MNSRILKAVWPVAFRVYRGDLASLLIRLILLVAACTVVGILIGVLAGVPVVNVAAGVIGALVELYGLIGVVLCALRFVGMFEDDEL